MIAIVLAMVKFAARLLCQQSSDRHCSIHYYYVVVQSMGFHNMFCKSCCMIIGTVMNALRQEVLEEVLATAARISCTRTASLPTPECTDKTGSAASGARLKNEG